LGLRDFLQATPERIFETDAGLVSINDNGVFVDCGFHGPAVIEWTSISQNFNDRRARAAHSDWHSLAR
jgi:hypothetical protein